MTDGLRKKKLKQNEIDFALKLRSEKLEKSPVTVIPVIFFIPVFPTSKDHFVFSNGADATFSEENGVMPRLRWFQECSQDCCRLPAQPQSPSSRLDNTPPHRHHQLLVLDVFASRSVFSP